MRAPPRACRTSDRTGTFRIISSRSAIRARASPGAYLASRILLRHHLGRRPSRRTRRSNSRADGSSTCSSFGPHPDDLEIGLGGTIAHHAARGLRVGLCDLTAGEMGSNGTVDERLAEAEAARAVLGAAWRENLRLARPPDRQSIPDISRSGRRLHPPSSAARRGRRRTGRIGIPIMWRRAPCSPKRSSTRASSDTTAGEEEAWKPEWVCYYFINDGDKPSFVVDVSAHYEQKRRALDCHVTQFRRPGEGSRHGRHAPEHADVPAAHREPRRAVRRARRRHVGRGLRRARTDPAPNPVENTVNIGIVCYASIGGSGIVATELGKMLAFRGHHVHVLSSEHAVSPGRLPARPVVSSRRSADVSGVPRAAVPAGAGEQDRPGVARGTPRHRPRALRRAARDGGISGPPDSGGVERRDRAARSSRRCTARTSRCSARTAPTRRSSRSRSSSRTA